MATCGEKGARRREGANRVAGRGPVRIGGPRARRRSTLQLPSLFESRECAPQRRTGIAGDDGPVQHRDGVIESTVGRIEHAERRGSRAQGERSREQEVVGASRHQGPHRFHELARPGARDGPCRGDEILELERLDIDRAQHLTSPGEIALRHERSGQPARRRLRRGPVPGSSG